MTQDNDVCFRWNSFNEDVRTSWREFQVEEDFYDVTLACEDKQIKSHKIIISSGSPVLRDILKLNTNPHPLIYLRRVKFINLQNLIHFMYKGEVNIAEEDLPGFLEVAGDLRVKGLVEGCGDNGDSINEDLLGDNYQNVHVSPKKVINEEKIENVNETHVLETLPTEDINNCSVLEFESKEVKEEKIQGSKQSLIHLKQLQKIICEECDKEFSHKKNLLTHVKSIHKGASYCCLQCDYEANQKSNLKKHVEAIHEGMRHPCSWCDYKATEKGSLKIHIKKYHTSQKLLKGSRDSKKIDERKQSNLSTWIKSIHKEASYCCVHCNYKANQKSNLKKHIEAIHDGVRHPCSLCDYKSTEKGSLQKHMKKRHSSKKSLERSPDSSDSRNVDLLGGDHQIVHTSPEKVVNEEKIQNIRETHILETLPADEITPCNALEIVIKEVKQEEVEDSIQSLAHPKDLQKFICEKCNKEFSRNKNLLIHIKSIHEGATYRCVHCDYKASQKSNLKKHIEAIHEGVRHPCSRCDYRATEKGSLKVHMKKRHSLIDLC